MTNSEKLQKILELQAKLATLQDILEILNKSFSQPDLSNHLQNYVNNLRAEMDSLDLTILK